MDYKVKKVVMTGGTSGIGLALIQKLLGEEIEILMLRRKITTRVMELPEHDLLRTEYCALEEIEDYIPEKSDYDVFFHLGWGNTLQEERNDMKLQMKNVSYSCEAVKLAYRCGCHTFIGAGSQAEYGRHDEALTPDTLCRPENAYGIAKLSACYATKLLCREYGIRHVWPRILSGYGLYDNVHSVLMSGILNALAGKKMEFSKGEQIWDFVYLDDIANALYLMARKGRDGAIYTIGSGSARTLKEYLLVLCEKLGKSEEAEFGKIPYSDSQIMHLEADSTELQRDTGWKPEVDFEDGIERVINLYKNKKEYREICFSGLYGAK